MSTDGKKVTSRQKFIEKSIWLLSTSRNALVVVGCSFMSYYFETRTDESSSPFILTGNVRSGMPTFQLPPFETQVGNKTYNFIEMCNELGTSILMIPVIAVLGNVAIAKAFGMYFESDSLRMITIFFSLQLVGIAWTHHKNC